ncbi:MAG: hypothetical protein JXR37_11800 [Kiritimatiellae bacterium]|nr:hypothetical protein [Kiritimatiellia bacterium]
MKPLRMLPSWVLAAALAAPPLAAAQAPSAPGAPPGMQPGMPGMPPGMQPGMPGMPPGMQPGGPGRTTPQPQPGRQTATPATGSEATVAGAEAVVDAATRADVDANGIVIRDPFWPIWYVPKLAEDSQEAVVVNPTGPVMPKVDPWKAAQEHLSLGGIAKRLDQKTGKITWFAFINNDWVQAGDQVSVEYENKTYWFQVREIDENRHVKLDPVKDMKNVKLPAGEEAGSAQPTGEDDAAPSTPPEEK